MSDYDINFLHYLVLDLLERIADARRNWVEKEDQFQSGIIFGFVWSLGIIKERAISYQIHLADICLDNVIPENFLLFPRDKLQGEGEHA